jgi:hypothetical protein
MAVFSTQLRRNDGGSVSAIIKPLTASLADRRIDKAWWTVPGVNQQQLDDEPDRHWRWKGLVEDSARNPDFEAWATMTMKPGYVEGAMILQVGVDSILRKGSKAVYVAYIASAPRNRGLLKEHRMFSGVGKSMMEFVRKRSAESGFGGRILLASLPSAASFYTINGFIGTIEQDAEGLQLFELPG